MWSASTVPEVTLTHHYVNRFLCVCPSSATNNVVSPSSPPHSCLRSWFQRQQTCPTCRMDVLRASNNNQTPAPAQAPPPAPAAPANAPVAPPANGDNTTPLLLPL